MKSDVIFEIDLDPVNRTAKFVVSKGIHFSPACKLNQPIRKESMLHVNYRGPKECNLVGKQFGRFTVIGYLGKHKPKQSALWDVRCACGNYERRRSKALKKTGKNGNWCRHCEYLEYLRWLSNNERT